MLTANQCQAFAEEYKLLAAASAISKERADMLGNIAQSFVRVATQLDKYESYLRNQKASGDSSAADRKAKLGNWSDDTVLPWRNRIRQRSGG